MGAAAVGGIDSADSLWVTLELRRRRRGGGASFQVSLLPMVVAVGGGLLRRLPLSRALGHRVIAFVPLCLFFFFELECCYRGISAFVRVDQGVLDDWYARAQIVRTICYEVRRDQ